MSELVNRERKMPTKLASALFQFLKWFGTFGGVTRRSSVFQKFHSQCVYVCILEYFRWS